MHAAAARQSPAQIARASGSNFLVSFVFLSPGRRRALLAVYAFCRVVDDAVDLAAQAPGSARERLDYWEEELDLAFAGEPRTPLGYALSRAAERFELDVEPLHELCAGMRIDLEPRGFASFDALRPYMSKVASAVGIACLPIFGADPARSTPYAEALGHALQYTNILRDLAEDGDRRRIYLPRDVCERAGVDPAWLCSSPPNEALADRGPLARMLASEHERARALYASAHSLMPAADRRALRAARIMGSVYRELLERVAALGPLVLTRPRVRVPTLRKLWLAVFGV